MNTTEQNSEDLITDLKNGDTNAINTVYDKFYRQLVYYGNKLINNRQEAEDIAVDSFMKMLDRKHNFDKLSEIKGFLYVTTKNACYNFLVREQKKPDWHSEILYLLKHEYAYSQSKMIQAEVYKFIMEAAERLPGNRKQIFKMIFLDGLDTLEVAKMLNISVDTVRVQKARAVHALRSLIARSDLFSIAAIIQLQLLTNYWLSHCSIIVLLCFSNPCIFFEN